MAKFLTTSGTSFHIENVIIEATQELVLVSPYLQISKTFFERLKDAASRNVQIKIIYGKDELKPNERNTLSSLSSLELFYFENLHAKCYFNQSSMVITSMNMYEFSEKTNREMGVYIRKEDDLLLFESAVQETRSILQSSERISIVRTNRNLYPDKNQKIYENVDGKKEVSQNQNTKHVRGYCIRCNDRIDFDTYKPYCFNCYMIWSQYENPEYVENNCHGCGEFERTSMVKPLCFNCYKRSGIYSF